MIIKKTVWICLILSVGISCKNDKNTLSKEYSKKEMEKPLQEAYKDLNKVEEEDMEAFVKRHNLPVIKTESGLRYYIYHKGTGEKIIKGKTVELNYSLKLITGVDVYSSKTDGNKILQVGQSDKEMGLTEGLLLMHVGDKAKLIIPSYLAYGLVGDRNKIPLKATLVYDLEVLSQK